VLKAQKELTGKWQWVLWENFEIITKALFSQGTEDKVSKIWKHFINRHNQ